MFKNFKTYLWVFLISMIPIIELRGAVPRVLPGASILAYLFCLRFGQYGAGAFYSVFSQADFTGNAKDKHKIYK